MPTWGKKHAYKHYFPLVIFSDEARRFATVACLCKAYKQTQYEFNRKHFTDNFRPFTYYFLKAFRF